MKRWSLTLSSLIKHERCTRLTQSFKRRKSLPKCRDANLWRSKIWKFFFHNTAVSNSPPPPKKKEIRPPPIKSISMPANRLRTCDVTGTQSSQRDYIFYNNCRNPHALIG